MSSRSSSKRGWAVLAVWAAAAVALVLVFCLAVGDLGASASEEGAQRLEDSLRETAAACYAIEGFYPPSVEYMEEHYGLQVADDLYYVDYILVADNLMPDFTVIRQGEAS